MIKMKDCAQRNHLLVSPRSLFVLLTTFLLLLDGNKGIRGLSSDEYESSGNITEFQELLDEWRRKHQNNEKKYTPPVDNNIMFSRKLEPQYTCNTFDGDICGCSLRKLVAAYDDMGDETRALQAIGFNTGEGRIVPVDEDRRVLIAAVGPNVAVGGLLDKYGCSHSNPSGNINQYPSFCHPSKLAEICSSMQRQGDVGSIRLEFGGTSSLNSAVSTGKYIAESLTILKSDVVSRDYGIAGEGMKIGIIANSFDMADDAVITEIDGAGNPVLVNYDRDISTGDLPPRPQVRIQRDDPGFNDEGRATAQIMYDQVPFATIFFRAGLSGGQEGLADRIKELCFIDDVDAMSDDLFFGFEPFFLPGVVAQAATEVSDAGCAFLTAAGNFYKNSYEGFFNGVRDYALGGKFDAADPNKNFRTARFHYFGPGVGTAQYVQGNDGAKTFVLQWDDRWTTYGRTSPDNDFDFYIITDPSADTITIIGSSEETNTKGGDPLESIDLVTADGNEFWLVIVARDKPGSSSSSKGKGKGRGLVRTGPSARTRSNLKQNKNNRVLRDSSSSDSSDDRPIRIKWVEFFNRIVQIGDITLDQADSGEAPEGVFASTVVGHRTAENIGVVGAAFWPNTPVGVDLTVEGEGGELFDVLNDPEGLCVPVFQGIPIFLEPPGCFTEAALDAVPTVERNPPSINCCGDTSTSLGGTVTTRDANSNLLPEVIQLRRPNFMGVDGLSNTFFGRNTNVNYFGVNLVPPNTEADETRRLFFGTSAAAPAVAAVALLLKQANRNLESSEIYEILEATAVDFDPVGTPVSPFVNDLYQNPDPVAVGFDFLTGYGLVDAAAALAIACPATVDVTLDEDRRRKLPQINEADEEAPNGRRELFWGGYNFNFNRDSGASSDDDNEYEIGIDLDSGCDLYLEIVEAHITVCDGSVELSKTLEGKIQDGATIQFTETLKFSNKCSIYFDGDDFIAEGYNLEVTVTAAFCPESDLTFTDTARLPSFSFSRESSSKKSSSSKGESNRRRRV